ncbi:MAG: sortase [Methanobrevibacter sp.]|nr:sortase [Methanobrevibacter sp.]
MNKPRISTIIVIICILIIGLYAMGEVNYFSSKISVERNIESPTVVIPSIGVQEKLNDVSLSQGVYVENLSSSPEGRDMVLFRHRTLQGSPFLRLNDVHEGDEILLEWPGVGELKYSVVGSTIVPGTSDVPHSENGSSIFLITCDPIGSTENRLIIEGNLVSTNDINNEILQSNPQESNAWYITIGFLALGLIFSILNPKEDRIYVIATVLIVTAILAYCCINPIPSELIYEKIIFLNGGQSWV